MHTQAQPNVEDVRAELHQQRILRGPSHPDVADFRDDRVFHLVTPRGWGRERRGQAAARCRGDRRIPLPRNLPGLCFRHGQQPQPVAGRKLTELPAIRLDHRTRTDEPAETRSVRSEDHRHVAGEVDGAEGVGIVVDVRRMQAGIPAVRARPLRARADQPYARATRVVMDGPLRIEKRLEVCACEEVLGAVRAQRDAQ